MYFIIDDLLPQYLKILTTTKVLAFVVRVLILFFAFAELTRTFSFLLIYLIGNLQMLLDCLALIQKQTALLTLSSQFKSPFHIYARVRLILRITSNSQGVSTAALMWAGLVLSVCVNFACLKLHSIIPMPLFLVFPTISILIPTIVAETLPDAINCFEKSRELIKNWGTRTMTRKVNNAFYLKKVRSLRPLKLYAKVPGYNLFLLKKSTQATYYSIIIIYTVNGLISFKSDSLKS